jgi:hypothetical protein
VQGRKLISAEIELARTVYRDTIPFSRVYITDLDLGGAVTLAGMNLSTRRFEYTINWVEGFGGVMKAADLRSTLIHELCHVWQGENGAWPTFYMGQSIGAQLYSGIEDIVEKREWKGWGTHRSTAYRFPLSAIGRNWGSFNVEQQASLIESWFMKEGDRITRIAPNRIRYHDFGPGVFGGGQSTYDPRFPYVRDVLRARNRGAAYRPIALPAGADADIKRIQDKLAALAYLDPRHADGTVGRGHSATLDAVLAFQRRNGLEADRELGGPNSETRRKLAEPVERLRRAL